MHFEAIYRSHYADVWRCLRRLGVSEREAQDATQEVFLIALKKLSEFEARSTLRTWLIGIAYRVAANRRRRADTTREVLGDQALAVAELESGVTWKQDQSESLHFLERVLNTLPLEQRAVFTMFELEELSGEEIAKALAIPVGTVRSRLRLAREHFARRVRQLSESEPPRTRAGGT
jgi:RNA polymerase sigma-70 factor (ECF subfamily)